MEQKYVLACDCFLDKKKTIFPDKKRKFNFFRISKKKFAPNLINIFMLKFQMILRKKYVLKKANLFLIFLKSPETHFDLVPGFPRDFGDLKSGLFRSI